MLLLTYKRQENAQHKITFEERFPWRNREVDIEGEIFFMTKGFLSDGEYMYKIPTIHGTHVTVGKLYFIVKNYSIYVTILPDA